MIFVCGCAWCSNKTALKAQRSYVSMVGVWLQLVREHFTSQLSVLLDFSPIAGAGTVPALAHLCEQVSGFLQHLGLGRKM